MKQPILEVVDLAVSFKNSDGPVHAIRDVSFTIYKGERVAIVGESGCGKSVLVKALIRLLPLHSTTISAQKIRFQDFDLLTSSEVELQAIRGSRIGIVFQDPMTSLNPTMKIGKQIQEKNQTVCPALLLKRFGVPNASIRIHEYPHTLSGGLRQRVLLAIALARNPELLIADEPTTALDVTIQAQILELLKEEQKDKSMILITHDLSIAAGFCDRVLVMYAGKIVEDAPVEALFENPRHPYTQKLLASIPRLDLSPETPLVPIAGSPPDLQNRLRGCAFCPRCSEAMNICRDQAPPSFSIETSHIACWKYDPRKGHV